MSFDYSETLASALPHDPFPTLRRWLGQARELDLRNPNAITLSTVSSDGMPAARTVLCKGVSVEHGYIVFYTNYESDKGRQLAATPRAAVVFHWDALGRQVRLSGPVVRSPAHESDAYFATRDRGSRLGAWASRQSEPVDSRQALLEQLEEVGSRFENTEDIPRPPYWGGFRLWASEVELWAEGRHRIHDRARWRRDVRPASDGSADVGAWTATRLQP